MRDDLVILGDLLDAISRIEKYAAEGRARFDSDELVQTWIVHHLQTVGEAARKLSNDFRSKAAAIPWPQIIAMRNILVHDYFGVDLDTVWTTVERELPKLKQEFLVAAFGARGVDREALASLLLFQQACAEERVTLEMIRHLAAELRRNSLGLVACNN